MGLAAMFLFSVYLYNTLRKYNAFDALVEDLHITLLQVNHMNCVLAWDIRMRNSIRNEPKQSTSIGTSRSRISNLIGLVTLTCT